MPGGTQHAQYAAIEQAANEAGFQLVAGKGSDPDTLKKQIVYVYDTAKYPFYQAEIYHQFHVRIVVAGAFRISSFLSQNDFQSPPYGIAYNKLADRALEDGRLKICGCPDRV